MRSKSRTERKLAAALKASVAVAVISAAAMMTASCSRAGDVAVTLKMKPGSHGDCALYADIRNGTNNHLNAATIEIGDFSLDIPSIAANTQLADVMLADLLPDEQLQNCEAVAKSLDAQKGIAKVTRCSAENLSEGDCQKEVSLEMTFDYAELRTADARFVKGANAGALAEGDYISQVGADIPVYITTSDTPPKGDGISPTNVRIIGEKDIDGWSHYTHHEEDLTTTTVTGIHKDARGLVDWYRVHTRGRLTSAYDLSRVTGWVEASDLERIFGHHPNAQ